jgi:hypothetical protein
MVAISIMTTAWPELPAYGCWTYEVVEQHQHWSHEERETQEKYANFRNASVVVTSTATVDTGINSANRWSRFFHTWAAQEHGEEDVASTVSGLCLDQCKAGSPGSDF